jgi:quinol monooxygenase YgiN
MSFIQTISFSTTKIQEIQSLNEDYDRRQSGQAPGFVGYKLLRDRDDKNAYMLIAEFETYELAMENSARPETDAYAKQMSELVDGEVRYGNYDVIQQG